MSISVPAAGEVIQLVTFVVGEEEYGVDILRVQEIIRSAAVTRVPNAPRIIQGVINLRGRVIPVIDLRSRFGMPQRDHDNASRIVVMELVDKIVGFIVDSVREVIHIEQAVVQPTPDVAIGDGGQFTRGIAMLNDRLIILLDPERILSSEEIRALETADPTN